jgi:hypothetical protein
MKKSLLLLLTLTPAAFGADVVGRFEPGTRYAAPDAHAPAQVSRMFMRNVSKSASVELPATGNGGMIIWTLGAESIKTRLRTPTGATLAPNDKGSIERGIRRIREGSDQVLHVMQTTPDTYSVDVDGAATIVAAEPDSPLTLSTWAAPLSRQPGEAVTLHAELRDGETTVEGARVTARLASPDGRNFDLVVLEDRGDGVYETTLTDLPAELAGAWRVRFDANGANRRGVRFARTGAGELVAERGAARLGSIRTEVIGDALRVSLPADVALAGAYRFDVIVADRAGNSLAWAEGPRALTTGATSLEIDIPLANLNGVAVEDLFLDARLLGLDEVGVAGRVTK